MGSGLWGLSSAGKIGHQFYETTMDNCIICKELLRQIEKDLNMDFHAYCSSKIITEAMKVLSENKD
jgi:hypothetical protein